MLNVPEKAQNRFCRDIAPVEWMLQRHAAHDKLISPMATNVPALDPVRVRPGAMVFFNASRIFFLFGGRVALSIEKIILKINDIGC
jgi:hypothetical protein